MLPSLNLDTGIQSLLAVHSQGIDHVGIAVRDLEKALPFYQSVLGMTVVERRETKGSRTGMVSAVLTGGPVTFVLVQGTSPQSQVNRYIENYGPGVQHIAVKVTDLEAVVDDLKARGLELVTQVIRGPGLLQAFSVRDKDSGIMLELIERVDDHDLDPELFQSQNVNQLFRDMEASDHF